MLLVFALLPFLVNGFAKQLPLGASPLQHPGALRNAPRCCRRRRRRRRRRRCCAGGSRDAKDASPAATPRRLF